MTCSHCYNYRDDVRECSHCHPYIGPTPHSHMSAHQAISEALFTGDPSEGDGWRRLLYRMANLLEIAYPKT